MNRKGKGRRLWRENNKSSRTEQILGSHKHFGALYLLGGGAGLTYLVKRLPGVWTVWSSNRGEEREFLFSIPVQTSPRTKSTYRTRDTVALFSGVYLPGRGVGHPPPPPEGKNE